MIILKHYKIIYSRMFYYAVAEEVMRCPDCGGTLKVRDSRKRKLIMGDGSTRVFRLRRLHCENCGSLHLEAPDCMVPGKHYAADVIADTVAGRRDDCPADDATIYRWKKAFG